MYGDFIFSFEKFIILSKVIKEKPKTNFPASKK